MADSSLYGTQIAEAESETETVAAAETSIIDLVGRSDDEEDDNDDVVLVTGMTKKRRSTGEASMELVSCNADVDADVDVDVIDLLDDSPASVRFRSSLTTTHMNHYGGATKITKKRSRTTTTSTVSRIRATTVAVAVAVATAIDVDAETIDLVDSGDDTEPGINGSRTNSNNSSNSNSSINTSIDNSNRTAQHLVLEPSDNAILTHGMLERIHSISIASCNYCWTCHSSNGTVSAASTTTTTTTTTTTAAAAASTANNAAASAVAGGFASPTHIQQNDAWSCGYRNYQMMLSALLPRIQESPEHSVFQKLPRRLPPTPISLPSLRKIQASMEDAWNEGFDPDGAGHYHHSIVDKSGNRAKIGAMEVANLCWYHGIDAVVLQFVKCFESRTLLPYFILSYFAQTTNDANETNNNNNNNNNNNKDATLLTRKVMSEAARLSTLSSSSNRSLLKMVSASSNNNNNSTYRNRNRNSTAMVPLLPIYLQWEGHSVTVVGIEAVAIGDQEKSSVSPPSFNFLVLDPMKKSQRLQTDLGIHATTTSTTTTKKRKGSHHQQRDELPISIKLPWKQISNKDLQIIVCTERSMSYSERHLCKSGGNSNSGGCNTQKLPRGRVITAAEDAVQKQLLVHQS